MNKEFKKNLIFIFVVTNISLFFSSIVINYVLNLSSGTKFIEHMMESSMFDLPTFIISIIVYGLIIFTIVNKKDKNIAKDLFSVLGNSYIYLFLFYAIVIAVFTVPLGPWCFFDSCHSSLGLSLTLYIFLLITSSPRLIFMMLYIFVITLVYSFILQKILKK
jgi:Na+/glutamate symporter